MNDKSIYNLHADVCKVLGHAIRIEIIDVLGDKELGFGEILDLIGGLKSNLSQHLKIMADKGILIQRREGLNSYYKVSSEKVSRACLLMREVLLEFINKKRDIIEKHINN